MDVIRTAVIGIGNMGRAHARCIYSGAIPGMKLAAVCDIRPESLEWARSELPGVTLSVNWESLIASGTLDAVIIAVPHPLLPLRRGDACRQSDTLCTCAPPA